MSTIWIRQFTGGLDARRMAETTPGGALIHAQDGHINRGGEFEKRAAFVKFADLPEGTTGLATGASGLVVFGSGATPAMPEGVSYQRLQEPGGNTLTKLLSTTRFAGPVYAVGQFSNGKNYHFYNAALVEDWFDDRPRASFTVKSGTVVAEKKASGTLTIASTGATVPGGTTFSWTSAKAGTTSLISGTVAVPAGVPAMKALADAVNAYTGTSGFTATYNSANPTICTVTAVAGGTAANGLALTAALSPAGYFTVSGTTMSGGVEGQSAYLSDVQVDGVSIITGTPIAWTGDASTTATAIASAITSAALGYTATALDTKVNLAASAVDPSLMGKPVTITATNITFDPASGLVLSSGGAFSPGDFVTTIGSKMYSVSGPNLHFSAIKDATKWQTGTGSGFIDMSSEASGSERLMAVAKYQQWIAVFGRETTQIWYVDPDPTLNKQAQVLNNTGTVAARSVVQFGDADLFYLDENGVRSLRARDASNAAATSDIGVPIDNLIIEKLANMTETEREDIKSVIEPRDGRYWLVMKDEIYVFSYFPGSKVSAWSKYKPCVWTDGVKTDLVVDDVAVYDRHVYLRSGDAIYVYGGPTDTPEYDETEPEVWLPYLDAETPTRQKHLTGVDVACEGQWEVSIGMQPTDQSVADVVATVTETTFNRETLPASGASTHFGLRFRGVGTGARRISSAVIHYQGDDDED